MEDVIRRARGGDPDALAHLWRTYNHLLLRYFRGKGMADPEDLASTVWIDVAGSLDRFEGGDDEFRRWLFTIAARRRIDGIRSSKRRDEHVRGEIEAASHDRHTAPGADDEAARTASLERAIALVRTLPPEQAEAVLLRIVADLSVRDVAEIMGRREGNVRVLVHRGLRKLAERTGKRRGPVTETPSQTMSAT